MQIEVERWWTKRQKLQENASLQNSSNENTFPPKSTNSPRHGATSSRSSRTSDDKNIVVIKRSLF
jgi:hypothetical protein